LRGARNETNAAHPARTMNLRPAFVFLLLAVPLRAAPGIAAGDLVRLTKSESLMFQGKELTSVGKGGEFAVLKHDSIKRVLFLEYYKDDGTLIAVTAPAEAFESCPPQPWVDLLKGVEAFRDLRADDARRLLARAAQDEQQRVIATALAPKISAAFAGGNAVVLQGLREAAAQLAQAGQLSLALALDMGVDRFGGAPPSKLDRTDLAKRVIVSSRALGRARQAAGVRKLVAAKKLIDEGLQAEPGRSDLKALAEKLDKEIAEADEHHKNANRMRQVPKGTVHALTAIEMGLKVCVDHPRLRALKGEMQSAFEERTSPPVTPALLALAGSSASKDALTEGHKLYTTRCAECHDLELLDSRSMTAWRQIVGGMSGRAKITNAQQERILDYIAVAQRTLDAE
jgi:hypothetical protein